MRFGIISFILFDFTLLIVVDGFDGGGYFLCFLKDSVIRSNLNF